MAPWFLFVERPNTTKEAGLFRSEWKELNRRLSPDNQLRRRPSWEESSLFFVSFGNRMRRGSGLHMGCIC